MPDSTRRTEVIFLTSFSSMRLLHLMPAYSPKSANGISHRTDFTVSSVRSPNAL